MLVKDDQERLIKVVADLQEEPALEMVRQYLADGVEPLAIIDLCHKGMTRVGELYDRGTYYVAALIMAGEIMRKVGELVLPLVESKDTNGDCGKILLGTVEGDIHFIGKDIFKTLIRGYGYTVRDLGVDVPAARFLAAIHELKPDIVGLSCIITGALGPMQETITFLRQNVPPALAPRAYMIGGHVNEFTCRQVGADYWVVDAMEGVHRCRKIMAGRHLDNGLKG